MDKKKKIQLETTPARQYRPRKRNDLTADEQQEIIDAYLKDYIP